MRSEKGKVSTAKEKGQGGGGGSAREQMEGQNGIMNRFLIFHMTE